MGAAGLLAGRIVTTNWFARQRVAAYGAQVRPERYLRDGKLVTGAGVSSGIDVGLFMAGVLAGEEMAQTIQLGIEYYPAPPFGNDGPDRQPRHRHDAIAAVERNAARRLGRRTIPFKQSS